MEGWTAPVRGGLQHAYAPLREPATWRTTLYHLLDLPTAWLGLFLLLATVGLSTALAPLALVVLAGVVTVVRRVARIERWRARTLLGVHVDEPTTPSERDGVVEWVTGNLAGDVARSLTVIGLVTAVGGLVSVGISTLLRSTAGALTSVFLLMLGLPVLLPGFDVRWLTALAERLPGYATAALLEAMEIKQLTTWTTVTVLATWTIATLAAGALSLWRRDA